MWDLLVGLADIAWLLSSQYVALLHRLILVPLTAPRRRD
jgi:hypothetical protein